MTIACPKCGADMPEEATFCPGCGQAMNSAERVSGTVGKLRRNVAGALAYFTFIPAVVFLMMDPYQRDRFVRFHSFQCLVFWLASLIAAAAFRLLAFVLSIVPLLGYLLLLLVAFVVGLALIVAWLLLVVKALQGEYFKLPVLGDLAERLSGAT
jgi:uncharacterized membrane protein